MPSSIYVEVTAGGRHSSAEVHLSREDIRELYEEEFGGTCPICLRTGLKLPGDICCSCFEKEMRNHSDCCMVE